MTFHEVLCELERTGLLLLADPTLPSIARLVTGERVRRARGIII